MSEMDIDQLLAADDQLPLDHDPLEHHQEEDEHEDEHHEPPLVQEQIRDRSPHSPRTPSPDPPSRAIVPRIYQLDTMQSTLTAVLNLQKELLERMTALEKRNVNDKIKYLQKQIDCVKKKQQNPRTPNPTQPRYQPTPPTVAPQPLMPQPSTSRPSTPSNAPRTGVVVNPRKSNQKGNFELRKIRNAQELAKLESIPSYLLLPQQRPVPLIRPHPRGSPLRQPQRLHIVRLYDVLQQT